MFNDTEPLIYIMVNSLSESYIFGMLLHVLCTRNM